MSLNYLMLTPTHEVENQIPNQENVLDWLTSGNASNTIPDTKWIEEYLKD